MMVEVNDLLYQGSIVIFMTSDKMIHGSVLVDIGNNYITLSLTDDDLSIVKMEKGIVEKLREGYVVYICSGNAYLGSFYNDSSCEEEKIFISDVDVSSIDYVSIMKNLEYKINNNLVRRKKLVKIGEFYQAGKCNDY